METPIPLGIDSPLHTRTDAEQAALNTALLQLDSPSKRLRYLFEHSLDPRTGRPPTQAAVARWCQGSSTSDLHMGRAQLNKLLRETQFRFSLDQAWALAAFFRISIDLLKSGEPGNAAAGLFPQVCTLLQSVRVGPHTVSPDEIKTLESIKVEIEQILRSERDSTVVDPESHPVPMAPTFLGPRASSA